MRRTCFVVGTAVALLASGCVKGAGTDETKTDVSSKRAAKPGELADSSPERGQKPVSEGPSRASASERDLCVLLSAKEIEEIAGVPIERSEKKPNGCEWFANAAAQQQKGAETARNTLAKLNKEEPKSAQELVGSMQNLLKGAGGAVAPDKPLFAVSVQRENADQAEALFKTTVAMGGGGAAGGGLEPIEGLGDRAFIGAMGAIFYVRKGATLITFGSMATRENTIALARRIVPRIE
jgi:hypothetical protein